MYWGLLLLLLLAVGVLIYVWRRNVRSVKQFGEAVRADVRKLSPQRQAAPASVAPMAPGAYAHRRRRHHM